MNRSRSILDIEGGNIIRQIDNALEQVMFNINDVSTDLKAREIKVSIRITPNKKRNELTVGYKVTPKLTYYISKYERIWTCDRWILRFKTFRIRWCCSRANQSWWWSCSRTSTNCCWFKAARKRKSSKCK